jgi:saccharopine dehydrogenase-like NADP-dependent oxidoreductase
MRKLLILGAGKIGGAIVDMLAATGDYDIAVADQDANFLALIPEQKARRAQIDVSDQGALAKVMRGREVVVSALPFFLNPAVAKLAGEAGAHYFDLTEDVATTRAVRALAEPMCRNAGWRRGSSASSRTTSPRSSTSCARCICASAPCPSSRSTPSNTT